MLDTAFKLAGSIFCIVMMAIVVGQDTKKNFKELNTAIVVSQALMMVLLWNTEFICGHFLGKIPYVILSWALLLLISGICVGVRFKDETKSKRKNMYLAFFAGNLILFALAFLLLRKKDCPMPITPPA